MVKAIGPEGSALICARAGSHATNPAATTPTVKQTSQHATIRIIASATMTRHGRVRPRYSDRERLPCMERASAPTPVVGKENLLQEPWVGSPAGEGWAQAAE